MASSVLVQRILLIFIFSLLTFYSVNCQLGKIYNTKFIDFSVIEKLEFDEEIHNFTRVINVIGGFQAHGIIKKFVDNKVNREIQRDTEDDIKCDEQVELLFAGFQNFESWALQMIDASSKIPTGILRGNIKDLGDYDECIAVKVQIENDTIRGLHCMYSLSKKESNSTTPSLFSPRLSVCLPAVCSPQRVSAILQTLIDQLPDYLRFLEITDVQCSSVLDAPFEIGEIVTIACFSLFLGFLVACTVLDVFIRVTSTCCIGRLNEFCKFSFYTNVLRIFDTTLPRGTIPSLQGIRFFSLCWVILAHQYLSTISGVAINITDAMEWSISWKAVYIAIAQFAVDTFFVLSGFLTSYLFMKEMSKGRKFNPIPLYIHRYIRLTPSLAALVLFSIYIIPRLGSGAQWETLIDAQKRGCTDNWWTILLYIQNIHWIGTDRCLGHAWYLAVDMQLFLISPLILYPLSKRPKIGLTILAAFMLASIITPAVMVGVNEYSSATMTQLKNSPKFFEMMKNFYSRPYTRAGPWLMGIFLGYEITKKRHASTLLRMTTGWIVALLSFAFIFFSHRIFQNVDYEWNAPWEVFYAGLSRHIWAFGVSWLIYASVHDYGGIVAKFLSHPAFVPFSKISYCVYLVHMVLQSMTGAASRVPVYFDDLEIINTFFGTLISSCVVGLVFTLVFESPLLVIEKMIFRRQKRGFGSREIFRDNEGTIGIDNCVYNNVNLQSCNEREKKVDEKN